MAQVGSLGGIVFTVSDRQIMTLQSASASGSASITEHKRHGGASIAEFTGSALGKMKLTFKVARQLGYEPGDMINLVQNYCQSGAVLSLTIGRTRYGRSGRWLIASWSVAMKRHDKNGTLSEADITVNLTEYL